MTAGRASRALETFCLGLAIACVGERCCLLCAALACPWTPMSFVLALVSRQLGRCYGIGQDLASETRVWIGAGCFGWTVACTGCGRGCLRRLWQVDPIGRSGEEPRRQALRGQHQPLYGLDGDRPDRCGSEGQQCAPSPCRSSVHGGEPDEGPLQALGFGYSLHAWCLRLSGWQHCSRWLGGQRDQGHGLQPL